MKISSGNNGRVVIDGEHALMLTDCPNGGSIVCEEGLPITIGNWDIVNVRGTTFRQRVGATWLALCYIWHSPFDRNNNTAGVVIVPKDGKPA